MKKFCVEISPFIIGFILVKIGAPVLWISLALIIGYILSIPIIAIRSLMSIPPDVKKEEVIKPVVDTNSAEYLSKFMPKI